VNAFDRLGLEFQSVSADFFSNLLQNSVGVLAFLVPWLLIKRTPRISLKMNLTLLVATAWNGVLVEVVRALVQRPRPLVYRSPLGDGANIHQYTSFYSGHTSFVALALLLTFLSLRDHQTGENRKLFMNLALLSYFALSGLTAALRVVGGRHYPTDTLAGFAFGSLVAFLSYRLLLRRIISIDP
jgi:membrane-associated phospholipid phosphatase